MRKAVVCFIPVTFQNNEWVRVKYSTLDLRLKFLKEKLCQGYKHEASGDAIRMVPFSEIIDHRNQFSSKFYVES